MDKTNTNTNINQKQPLEDVLKSYNILLQSLFVIVVLIIILYFSNQKGFNKIFGYEIFISIPLLLFIVFVVKQSIILKNTPNKSFLTSINLLNQYFNNTQSDTTSLLLARTIMALGGITVVGAIIGGFYLMLYVAGIFSNNPPENNIAALINSVIIIIVLTIMAFIYIKDKKKDDTILSNLPEAIQNLYSLRRQYTMIFVAFVIGITLLYLYNPFEIMTKYGGPVIFFTLFIGIIFVIMITAYQYFLANPSKANVLKDSPKFLSLFIKGIYILSAFGISAGLIYAALKSMGIFEQDASKPESWGHIIFNLLLFCGMLSIIYKLANTGGFLDQNPYYRLILNTLLYIPCLLVSTFSYLGKLFGFVQGPPGSSKTFTPPTASEFKVLGLSLILLGGYFLWFFVLQSKYLQQGGKQLINQPVSTDILTNVASYQHLNDTFSYDTTNDGNKFSYQYAIPFWTYLDSFPPSTSSAYTKIVPILSYGENPCVKYSSNDNTIYITVKQKSDETHIIEDIQKDETEIKPEKKIKLAKQY
jgi:hypothetical protein